MNENDKDPFEKYDRLFEEQDRNSIVQPASQKKEPQKPYQQKPLTPEQKAKAVRLIMTVIFAVLFIQVVPVILFRNGLNIGGSMLPVFSFIFMIVIVNIIIKAFKR